MGHVYAFPNAARIARVREKELRECALGYRAKNFLATARRVDNGEADLETWRNLPDDELRERLCELPGVGAKVANCVMLFAYERLRAFPIDVWIERVLREKYFPRRRKVTAAKLRAFCDELLRRTWGLCAAIPVSPCAEDDAAETRRSRKQGPNWPAGLPVLPATMRVRLVPGIHDATFRRVFAEDRATMSREQERRNIWLAVLASLFLHVVVALSLATFNSAAMPLPAEEDKPVELTMVDLAAAPQSPSVRSILLIWRQTHPRNPREKPKEKTFESNANSIAASTAAGNRRSAVPSQEGKDRPYMESEDPGSLAADEAKQAVPEKQPTPPPQPRQRRDRSCDN